MDTVGDGFFATFDGPARAIRCACAIREAIAELGLEMRAGVHAGECQLIGGKAGGIAVHIGARISSLAEPGEVLVSSTVRDLVAGSGIEFDDRGEHELKGIAEPWHLFTVQVSVGRRRVLFVLSALDRYRRVLDPADHRVVPRDVPRLCRRNVLMSHYLPTHRRTTLRVTGPAKLWTACNSDGFSLMRGCGADLIPAPRLDE